MCEEKVETDRSIDCASPMSAYTASKIAIEPSSRGSCIPDWCINANSPIVFIATVLPPVFGPVITRPRKPGPMLMVIGTASLPNKGCRAPTRFTTLSEPGGIVSARRAFIEAESRARAAM